MHRTWTRKVNRTVGQNREISVAGGAAGRKGRGGYLCMTLSCTVQSVHYSTVLCCNNATPEGGVPSALIDGPC